MIIILTDGIRGGFVIGVHGVRVVMSESINLQFRQKISKGTKSYRTAFLYTNM